MTSTAPSNGFDAVLYRLLNPLEEIDKSLWELSQSFMDLAEGVPDTAVPSALIHLEHNELCAIVIDEKHWIANWNAARHCFTLFVGSHDVTLDEIEEWWPLEWELK